ncbi:MAG: tetratricopeptide repeat protein [Bacteroidales bacterium]
MKYALICILFFFCASSSFAQNDSDLNQLALLYYSKNEYTRAAELYEKLYANTHSDIHFKYVLSCYKNLDLFEKSKKIIQEQIEHKPDNLFYKVALIQLYQENDLTKESEKLNKKTKRAALRNKSTTIELLKAYKEHSLINLAHDFIPKARKKYNNSTELSKIISSLYIESGLYKKSIQEYLNLIIHTPEELSFVQEQLQFILFENNTGELSELLAKKTIEKLDTHKDNTALYELLIWVYIQEQDFSKAFHIAQSLDIQENGNGKRIFEIGKIAKSQKKYTAAIEAFSYILSKGQNNNYYRAALKLTLETTQEELFNSQNITQEKLQNLEKKYTKALETLGKNNETVDIARGLAHIQAFYLNKSSEAQQLLEHIIEIPRIHPHEKALCQLELANIMVFNDDVWSANLLYAKIALNYKNNDIGHRARYKQAKLAYYNAQFSYAQALLDILKANTTKLISNDALELSQLIAKHAQHDTTAEALTLFAQADLRIYQKKHSAATRLFDSIAQTFPGHSLQSMILFRKSKIANYQNDTTQRITYLEKIVENYPYDIITHKAHFLLAEYYHKTTNNKDKARFHYKKIIDNYPNSFYITQARKEYRKLLEQ